MTANVTASDEKLFPFLGSLFSVSIDGKAPAIFTEVSGLTIDVQDVESVVNIGGREVTRFTPGTVTYNEISLKRELTDDKSFYEWVKKIADGSDVNRTTASISVHNYGGDVIGEWSLLEVWPSAWSCSDVDVGSDDVMSEEVTLQVEQLIRIK